MFITFEGGEGSGKTSLIESVYRELKNTYPIIKTREPGGSLVAEAIRDVVLNPKYHDIKMHTEALLYAASRAQHLDEVIIPALEKKQVVLCDRYLDSSLAYQAHARHLGFDFVLKANDYALKNMPTLTFYIDLDPKEGLRRISGREHLDRLDQEDLNFHYEVREGYLKLLDMYPKRMIKLDGTDSLESLKNQIVAIIKERL